MHRTSPSQGVAPSRHARASRAPQRTPRPRSWLDRFLVAILWLLAGVPAHAGELPPWPMDGEAERRFVAGPTMFVEERSDRWRAWVLPDQSYWTPHSAAGPRGPGWRGRVLDFFSGSTVDAELHVDELGHARPVFFSGGGVHAPARVEGGVAISQDLLPAPRFRGLEFVDDDRFDPARLAGCSTRLMVVNGHDPATQGARWSRLVLRRSPPSTECPHGRWSSQVIAVLDLHDGTFLAALDDRVVRLDAATLEPVGTGSRVHVVDAGVVAAAMEAGGDVHALLNAMLRLRAADGARPEGIRAAQGAGGRQ